MNSILIQAPWVYKQGDECLIAILSRPIVVAFASSVPESEFRLAETAYDNLGLGDWNGFYNYLRLSRDQVVGVEFEPDDNNLLRDLKRLIGHNPQLLWKEAGLIVFFGKKTHFDPNWTSMGHFGWNSIFRSKANVMAITFGLQGLSEISRENLATSMNWNV